jgi:hypothetical protein
VMRARLDRENLIEGETVESAPAPRQNPEEPIIIAGEIEEPSPSGLPEEPRSESGRRAGRDPRERSEQSNIARASRAKTAASVGKSRAAVLRRREQRRFSSASDDEVGGFHARLREQLQLEGGGPSRNRPFVSVT